MKFSPSLAAEHFLEAIHPRVGARNKSVLARSALLLALGETIPPDFHPADSQGKDLDDSAIISDELHDLVHAALNHRAGHTLDEAAYRQSFRLHFEYGCHRLSEIWQQSGHDPTRFVATLLRIADDGFHLPLLLDRGEGRGEESILQAEWTGGVQKEIKLKVLSTAPDWSLNGPGTSNGLLVISGQPGSGKSQLALDLLAQLSAQGVRFIFFDMRGELSDEPNTLRSAEFIPQDPSPSLTPHLSSIAAVPTSIALAAEVAKEDASRFTLHASRLTTPRFLEQTGARYLRLIHEGLPINPLYRDPNPTVNAQIAYEIANLIRCFAPQFGPRQEDSFCKAYQQLDAPDFPSLVHALENTATPGVDLAIIQKIDRLKLFASADTALDPETWLNASLVIDFKEFGSDSETKALSAALILNFLMKKLSRNLGIKDGIQPLKMVLFVDEAHLLLPKENKAGLLGSLARQGRSWGFPVWLASQDADAFVTTGANPTNFAELAECGVHFSPHTLTDSQQRLILGGIIPQRLSKGEAALRLQGNLVTGPARQFWKTNSRSGELAFAANQSSPLPSDGRGSKGEGTQSTLNNPPSTNLGEGLTSPSALNHPPSTNSGTGDPETDALIQQIAELGRIIEGRSNSAHPQERGLPVRLPPPDDTKKSAA